ncbi:uncharacterized protein LOC120195609 [Hibiscus syriacus]|uniref:uncharacterized protein LOC120195609 n=1 Tax=Hibiscus syriacus TaxID=106335 RepID=UPI001923006F|nr:uncharacterized protein LOC120195609 [Hibiscus syriacus]
MTVSIEALAMAGADYNEWGLDIEEWEDDDDLQCPPPHLLADEKEEEPAVVVEQVTQIIDTSRHSEDFNAIGELRNRRAFRGRALAGRILQSSKSIKRVKCMIMQLMVESIFLNLFLNPV